MSQQLTSSVTGLGPGGNGPGMNPNQGGMPQGMNPNQGPPQMMGGFNNVMPGDMMVPSDCGMMNPNLDCGGPMGNPPFGGPMGPMGMGPRSMSPKLGGGQQGGPIPPQFVSQMGPRGMLGRPPQMGGGGGGMYNGANVQVKPGASNTIQYLPPRPQMGVQNPRAPPNLEFLQRYAGPMNNNPMNVGPMDGMPPRMQVSVDNLRRVKAQF